MSDDEVKKELEKEFSNTELKDSYNNFFIDNGSMCLIINEVVGSGYPIVKLK